MYAPATFLVGVRGLMRHTDGRTVTGYTKISRIFADGKTLDGEEK